MYQTSDYYTQRGLAPEDNNALRDDTTLTASVQAGYLFTDWLSVDFQVGLEDRDSNLAGYDYSNTFVEARIDLAYDLGGR